MSVKIKKLRLKSKNEGKLQTIKTKELKRLPGSLSDKHNKFTLLTAELRRKNLTDELICLRQWLLLLRRRIYLSFLISEGVKSLHPSKTVRISSLFFEIL